MRTPDAVSVVQVRYHQCSIEQPKYFFIHVVENAPCQSNHPIHLRHYASNVLSETTFSQTEPQVLSRFIIMSYNNISVSFPSPSFILYCDLICGQPYVMCVHFVALTFSWLLRDQSHSEFTSSCNISTHHPLFAHL